MKKFILAVLALVICACVVVGLTFDFSFMKGDTEVKHFTGVFHDKVVSLPTTYKFEVPDSLSFLIK